MISEAQQNHERFFESLLADVVARGCDYMISHSNTTHSSYLSIGCRLENGGFAQHFEVRISDHAKPSFRKNGFDKKMKQFIASTSTVEKHRERIVSLIPQCGGSGRRASYQGNRIVWE